MLFDSCGFFIGHYPCKHFLSLLCGSSISGGLQVWHDSEIYFVKAVRPMKNAWRLLRVSRTLPTLKHGAMSMIIQQIRARLFVTVQRTRCKAWTTSSFTSVLLLVVSLLFCSYSRLGRWKESFLRRLCRVRRRPIFHCGLCFRLFCFATGTTRMFNSSSLVNSDNGSKSLNWMGVCYTLSGATFTVSALLVGVVKLLMVWYVLCMIPA